MGDPLAVAGAIAAAVIAAAGLMARDRRASSLALALALVLAAVLLLGDSWHDSRVVELRDHPPQIAAALIAGAIVVALLAAAIRRRPAAFPLLVAAVLPFRIPIDAGGSSANLLIPLYVVLAAAIAAALWDAFAADPGAPDEPVVPEGFPGLAARVLPGVLAAVIVLYAIQTSYSSDFSMGLHDVCFFYVPFMALFALLLRVRWTAKLLVAVLGVTLAEAFLFTAIGIVEYAAKDILWNPEVMAANLFHPVFRVNSLFWDPNILARYLAIAAVALTAVLLGTESRRLALLSAAGTLVLVLGMGLSFSQSGFLALLAGFVVLAALRWSARWTVALGGIAALGLAAFVVLGGTNLDFSLDKKRLNAETSGRFQLFKGGLQLAEQQPVFGLGSGSFSDEFAARFGSKEAGATASHTEPITVFAEQGAVGLTLYVALLVVSVAALLAGLGPLAPGLRGFAPVRARPPPDPGRARTVLAVSRATALAAYCAMLVHSLSYAAFLTDPITWGLLALGLALVRDPRLAP